MKFLKYFMIILIIFAGLGFGVYHFGTKFASTKLVDTVSTELEETGEMEQIRQTIESDPELTAFIDDVESVDESKLPFTTKEEATKVIIKKLGISGLRDIQSKVEQSQMTKEELLQVAQDHFTDEEIEALKVIAYKEFYQN